MTHRELFFPAGDSRSSFAITTQEQIDLLNWLAQRGDGVYREQGAKAFLKLGQAIHEVAPSTPPPKPKKPEDKPEVGDVVEYSNGLVKVIARHFDQQDSATGHGGRMCFSSCDSMMAATMTAQGPHPLFPGPNDDDIFLKKLFSRYPEADTVNQSDQIWTLGQYGIRASFSYSLTWEHLIRQIRLGIPVPIGVLHHGHVSAPSGDGHYILAYGIDEENVYCNDPYGELDLVNGVWLNTSPKAGKNVTYSRKNLGPRWMVKGGGGWGMIAQPLKKPA